MVERLTPVVRVVILTCSVTAIALLVWIVSVRVGYPYELEWMEGTMVDSVSRIRAGQSLYERPSVEFLPTVYNPVFFYVAAAVSSCMGAGVTPLRLVSVVATLGILALLWRRLDRARPRAGLVAAGLYAASFRFAGAWMDIAKTDSLCLFLLLAGFLLGRGERRLGAHIATALVYALACYTKQSAVPVILMVIACQLVLRRNGVWIQLLLFCVVTLAVFAGLDWYTAGWYSFYTLDNVLHFEESSIQAVFFRRLIRGLLPVMMVTGLYAGMLAVELWHRRSSRILTTDHDIANVGDEHRWDNLSFALALIVSTLLLIRQRGTYTNILLPACLGFAILAGLALEGIRARIERHRADGPHAVTLGGLLKLEAAVAVLIAGQFALYAYNPLAQLPTRADRAAGDDLVQYIRRLPGDVLVWSHGYYTTLAGKGMHLHRMNYTDVAGLRSVPSTSDDNRWRRALAEEAFDDALRRHVFAWIIVDRPDEVKLFSPYYLPVDSFENDPGVFIPVTGRQTRPEWVLKPNPDL
jgi:hypothetical protein